MYAPVSYTHLRAHETSLHLVCRLLLAQEDDRDAVDEETDGADDPHADALDVERVVDRLPEAGRGGVDVHVGGGVDQ